MPEPTMQQLDINLIDIRGGTQARAEIDEPTVADYTDAMEAGDTFPPLVVFHDGKTHWLADGFHRYWAYTRRDTIKVPVEIHNGTRREAILYACQANARHGLRRTNADKREAVVMMLHDEEWSQWSDRAIAEHIGVDHKTVGKVRKESTGEIPQSTAVAAPKPRKTKAGRTIDTANIGTNQPAKKPEPDEFDGFGESPKPAPGNNEPSKGGDDPDFDAPQMKDPNGRVIPDELVVEVFNEADCFADWQASIQTIRKEAKAIKDTRLGARILQALDVSLKDAWQQLKHATPYCVCPLCEGKAPKKCGCKGAGWINKEQYEALPEDKR